MYCTLPPPPTLSHLACLLLVQSYYFNDDVFNFNYAQAKAATGSYSEAEEVFLLISSEIIRNDYIYQSWLARCCEPHNSTMIYATLSSLSTFSHNEQ